MKRFVIFACLLGLSNFIFASPVGNPSAPKLIEEGIYFTTPSWVSFRIGYEGNFTQNGMMVTTYQGKPIDCYEQDTNSGTFTINIQNRFDIYGTVGAYRTKASWRIEPTHNSFSKLEMETHYNWAWSTGVKGIFFEWGNTTFTAGGRYSNISSPLFWLTKDSIPYKVDASRLDYREWQIDIGLSHKIEFLTPYVGAQYTNTHSRIHGFKSTSISNQDPEELQMKSKEHFGIALGCAISAKKIFFLNLEVRLLNEEAFTVVGDFKF